MCGGEIMKDERKPLKSQRSVHTDLKKFDRPLEDYIEMYEEQQRFMKEAQNKEPDHDLYNPSSPRYSRDSCKKLTSLVRRHWNNRGA
jgi:uridine kinase